MTPSVDRLQQSLQMEIFGCPECSYTPRKLTFTARATGRPSHPLLILAVLRRLDGRQTSADFETRWWCLDAVRTPCAGRHGTVAIYGECWTLPTRWEDRVRRAGSKGICTRCRRGRTGEEPACAAKGGEDEECKFASVRSPLFNLLQQLPHSSLIHAPTYAHISDSRSARPIPPVWRVYRGPRGA